MDFKNVSARLKSKGNAQSGDGGQPKQHDFAESYRIRARMIGVLIHDARSGSKIVAHVIEADRSTAAARQLPAALLAPHASGP